MHLLRPTFALTLQRRLLVAGAAFDLAFAAGMLLFPRTAAAWLSLELPQPPTWFQLTGVLLAIAAGAYLVASRVEVATQPVALVAGLGRMAGCFVLVAASSRGEGLALLAAGLLDGALGIAHVITSATRWPPASIPTGHGAARSAKVGTVPTFNWGLSPLFAGVGGGVVGDAGPLVRCDNSFD